MDKLILTVKNLVVRFSNKTILDKLSFSVPTGDFLSVVGENGVGKTTLIKVILGLLKPTAGEVRFFPNRKSIRIGYVPQFRNVSSEYPLSIRDFVALNFKGFKLPLLTKKEKNRLKHVLKITDLEGIQSKPLGKVSGGEKQRAYLAQALLNNPNLLILDESTASLDPNATNRLLSLVKKENEENNLTVIFVTHDLENAKKYSSHFLFLKPHGYEIKPIKDLKVE